MSDRNLNPHAEARAAMAIWSHEYAYDQKGGSMDFWESRTPGQKATCVKFVDDIRGLPRADGTPAPIPSSVGLPQDIIDLVIAAREAFDTGMLPVDENRTLDKALEAFSSRVPYANEPDALEDQP